MNNSPAFFRFTRRQLLLGTAAFALAGCADLKGIVGPPPAPQLYVLRPPLPTAAAGAPLRWQLIVAIPEANASIDTSRIALHPTAGTIDYYANAAWADRAPLLLQSLLLEALENTRRISVARDTAGIVADYVLQTELREFQANYDAPPVAGQPGSAPHISVQIEAKLMALPDHRLIGALNVMQRADAQGNSMESIAAAFNQALGAAIAQIVDWTLRTPPTV